MIGDPLLGCSPEARDGVASRAPDPSRRGPGNRFRATACGACRGFVLVTALILMLVLTVLAVGGVSLFGGQVRTAANIASQEIAFQAAEAALQQAQTNIFAGAYPLAQFQQDSGGLYQNYPLNPPLWTTIDWTSSAAVIPVTILTGLPSGVQAAYTIELMAPVVPLGSSSQNPSNVYRITAEGTQASGGAPVILQSVVIQ